MAVSFVDFPVYKRALGLAKEIDCLCRMMSGKEFYFLRDQLRRATASVALNIAEGSGKWSKKDKINFYRIARGSAFESVGALDLFSTFSISDEKQLDSLRKEFLAIGGELQALIFSIEKR